MMNSYKIFQQDDVLAYVVQHNQWFENTDNLEISEISDGNLNSVFRVKDKSKNKGIIVKQALPYIRCVGEAWALTRERAVKEINVLLEHAKYAPESTVKILYYDYELSLMILEDLAEFELLRSVLLRGDTKIIQHELLAKHVAKTLFCTSSFALAFVEKAHLEAKTINPEMCQTTNTVFFSDPYYNSPQNNFHPQLTNEVKAIWAHDLLKQEVAILQDKFKNQRQALLHGDLHTGSILVTPTALKVIDAEFGFYGPIGFDLGVYIANLILNYESLVGYFSGNQLEKLKQNTLDGLIHFWKVFQQEFNQLLIEKNSNILIHHLYANYFIQQLWQDSLGFAGTEIIRRTIGIAHVDDIDNINNENVKIGVHRRLLHVGQALILNRRNIQSYDVLIKLIKNQ